MRHWLTRADMRLRQGFVKRFEPSHWTVDFPRGSMASVVSVPGEEALRLTATFARKGDLVGLIYTSDDAGVHIGHRRTTNRDYSRCTLRFRWRSTGIMALDAANGPTLTIERRAEDGTIQASYVRLWNYAVGSGTDAIVTLPFDDLRAGYFIEAATAPVDVTGIERLFISVVPPGYEPTSSEPHPTPMQGEVELSDLSCDGSGSVVSTNDTFVPEHGLRICTAYDDCYNLTPERVIDGLERLGYRKLIDHYVGMSHYPALKGTGLVDSSLPINLAARRWHESFAAIAADRGYSIIWSLSMEVLDQFCPEEWKQRDWLGNAALTGYSPPSTLLSPCVAEAVEYLASVATAFVTIGADVGLEPQLQVGEPNWWINADHAPCLYDEAAKVHWPADHVKIADVRLAGPSETEVLEQAGALLSDATSAIVEAVRQLHPSLRSHLLVYLPSALRPDAPAMWPANLPRGWEQPAFDVLQLEDYEWVTEGRAGRRRATIDYALAQLKYSLADCHYISGFVQSAQNRDDWPKIIQAAEEAQNGGFSETFLWALPQVFRDSLTIFEGEPPVEGYCDVSFPLELGLHAAVEPCFSTSVSTSPSGFEYRNVNWQQARLKFDVGPGLRSLEDVESLLSFFRSMRGNAVAFRFRDTSDFSSAGMTGEPSPMDVQLGIGDGETRLFPLFKRYGDGEVRRITRPVADSIRVAVGGETSVAWRLIQAGVIEFDEPPPEGSAVQAGFLFDVPVRFEEESLKIKRKTFLAGEVSSVALIEVREA